MLRSELFDSKIEQAFFRWYERVCSIAEIETNKVLQWVMGATILSYFVTFGSWISSPDMTVDVYKSGAYLCWPYFQSCGQFYFLRTLPLGYSQSFFYMAIFVTLLAAIYCMYRRDWVLAHFALLPSFIWHFLGTFVLTMKLGGNYDYYLFIFGFTLLFLPYKEFFLKLFLVAFYFLSTFAKIHPAWVLGTYFSSLTTGLPLFPDWAIPLLTNSVIGMEMVGSWFLMSSRIIPQRIAVFYAAVFHLYSGLLVQYHYPVIVLPTLLILFGPMYRYTPVPLTRRSLIGWGVLTLLFVAQLTPILIPGDEKLTMEGDRYGLYMFDSNHQCISTAHVIFKNGTSTSERSEKKDARNRCDPHREWFQLKTLCERDPSIDHISWTFDHSINGGPFLRIVDVPNACDLSYQPFSHNSWINYQDPAIIGTPVENGYY